MLQTETKRGERSIRESFKGRRNVKRRTTYIMKQRSRCAGGDLRSGSNAPVSCQCVYTRREINNRSNLGETNARGTESATTLS